MDTRGSLVSCSPMPPHGHLAPKCNRQKRGTVIPADRKDSIKKGCSQLTWSQLPPGLCALYRREGLGDMSDLGSEGNLVPPTNDGQNPRELLGPEAYHHPHWPSDTLNRGALGDPWGAHYVLLGTGAACSALTHSPGPLSSKSCLIPGVDGHPQSYHFTQLLGCCLGNLTFSHTFLVSLGHPFPHREGHLV